MGQSVQSQNIAPSSSRAGEIIAGRYRLERELGRGAMGTVWAATHVTLLERVAVKLISAEYAQAEEARTRFSTEAKAAARLRSRHVVHVYDHGETSDGTPYIVMEYLEGESLEARLEREGTLTLVDAAQITTQVARALAKAHAHGIVHRDLKPGNIFLARSDEEELGWVAKVLDFGIAKIADRPELSTTRTGTVLGTPLFMSPEQVRRASQVDHRADLYSLGMCFYNMVTGRYAFDGDSFGEVLVSICTEPLPDIRSAAPWVSQEVAAWFQRCCARDPAARYQSAEELAAALHDALGATFSILNRGSVPEEQLGPSGTVKGHSPPIGPHILPLAAEESGAFTVRFRTLPGLHDAQTEPGLQGEASSIVTVNRAALKRRKRLVAAAAIGACVAALAVAALSARDATAPNVESSRAAIAPPNGEPAPPAKPLPQHEPAHAAPPSNDGASSSGEATESAASGSTPASASTAASKSKSPAKTAPKSRAEPRPSVTRPASGRPAPQKARTSPDLGF